MRLEVAMHTFLDCQTVHVTKLLIKINALTTNFAVSATDLQYITIITSPQLRDLSFIGTVDKIKD